MEIDQAMSHGFALGYGGIACGIASPRNHGARIEGRGDFNSFPTLADQNPPLGRSCARLRDNLPNFTIVAGCGRNPAHSTRSFPGQFTVRSAEGMSLCLLDGRFVAFGAFGEGLFGCGEVIGAVLGGILRGILLVWGGR